MPLDVPELYRQVANLSESMLQAAQDGRWEDLIQLELQRSQYIDRLHGEGEHVAALSDDAQQSVRECIERTLACDRETGALAQARIGELASVFASSFQERRVLDAYR